MLLEEPQRKRARLVDGDEVALACGHDRAAKDDLELVREESRPSLKPASSTEPAIGAR